MSNFGAILTNAGAAKLANAIALGVPLKLTQMAVGDGNGQPVTPDPAMPAIPGEKRRAAINTLFPDPLAASQLVAEQIIPEDVGGWWIRCVGLYDDSNTLIAVANVPDTYKPLLTSGAGRTQIIRMVLIVSDTNSVALKIDPAVVLATRKYVDDVMKAHKELGSALIGVPCCWPLTQMPQDIWPECGQVFLSCAGQPFNKSTYPALAQAYPSGVLPDLRGEFIRGWDNGRGVDEGRGLLSEQWWQTAAIPTAVGNQVTVSGEVVLTANQGPTNSLVFPLSRDQRGDGVSGTSTSNAANTSGKETRPINIAFHYIVRAS